MRRDRATRAQQRAANPDKRGAHTTPMGTFAMLTCIALAGYAGTTPEHVARRQGFGHTAWVNAERRYKETKRASPQKQQTRGPRRKLNDDEWADLYTELCDNQGEGYRDIALKYGVSIATISRECGTASGDPNSRSDRGQRSKEKGKEPITLKVPQVLMSEANMPRIVDMHMSWLEAMEEFDAGLVAYTDECPIFYGEGQHSRKGRAPQGEMCVQEKPYRWKRATLCMAVTKYGLIKAVVAGDTWGGSKFRDFMLEESLVPTVEYPNLGGPAVSVALEERGTRVVCYDMLGRSGQKQNPTAQHFHPDIKPGLASCGVLGLLGPPKFGIQDPIELINGLIQGLVRACALLHLAETTEMPGSSCKTRRYARGRLANSIRWIGRFLARRL